MDRVIQQYPRVEIGVGLRWCESLGIAFQEDMSKSLSYAQAYFNNFASYEGTVINNAVNEARIAMVRRSQLPIIDIGIGCGTFLKSCARHGISVLGGFDVNRAAVAWLRDHDLWIDLYHDDLPELTTPFAWTLWDVIEHLRCPHKLLDRVRIGDYLFVTVPIYFDLCSEVLNSKH